MLPRAPLTRPSQTKRVVQRPKSGPAMDGRAMSFSHYADRDALFDDFARYLSPGKANLYRAAGMDLVMGERGGVTFRDAYDGRVYYNCHCNGGVFNLGHRNPRVVSAVRDALGELDIGNHHLASGYRTKLAARLCASAHKGIEGVIFGVSGGEAVDLAIKLVRGVTGRMGVVSASGGYHGHTGLALSAGDPAYRDAFGPVLPGFLQVPFNDVGAMRQAVTHDTAAVILEPIPATLGMPIAEPGYFRAVWEICQERGAKLICDEVQTGLGRTGTIWYFQQLGVEPDVIVTGKGLSGGVYPITATLLTREVHSVLDERPFCHVSTFGGAELGCVAALTTLDIVEEPGFLERVQAVSERFGAALSGLPFELRRKGLMMGIRLGQQGAGMLAVRRLAEEGVFAVWANNDTSVVQLLPPLIVADAEVDEITARVRRALS